MISYKNEEKGITLIALVVTIILLIILAGVSINALAGQNGLLKKATDVKEKTAVAQRKENLKTAVMIAVVHGNGKITNENLQNSLNSSFGEEKYQKTGDEKNGWIVTIEGERFKIDADGKVEENTKSLPKAEGTTPYLPNSTFSYKDGDLSTGLVINDSAENEYVWVEVPTSIYEDATYNSKGTNKPSSSDDWQKIEKCLKSYSAYYTYSAYSDSNSTFLDLYKNMLKSVYENGGFWIGRYEAGIENNRKAKGDVSDLPITKANMYPYNYVSRDQAQNLATGLNYGNCTSSLIFGLQWNLVLKYIEVKTINADSEIGTKLKTISTTIGNCKDSVWNVTSKTAKYSSDLGNSFWSCPYEKNSSGTILLTTGANTNYSFMNIYDLAGNVREWTLEYYTEKRPCVGVGGCYFFDGSWDTAYFRFNDVIGSAFHLVGFRVGIWK